MSIRNRLARFILHWHARIGFLSALLLLVLVTTGIALNHSESLGLARTRLASAPLLQWYGLKSATSPQGYVLGNALLAWGNGAWALGGRQVTREAQPPVGAAEVGGVRYVATADKLYLFSPDGQLIDRLDANALPGVPVRRLGQSTQRIALDTPSGVFASADALEWQRVPSAQVEWSTARRLTAGEVASADPLLAPSVSLQQVLLDLHSGRLFGRYGPWVVDFAAFGLAVLSVTGFWMYMRSVRRFRMERNHGRGRNT